MTSELQLAVPLVPAGSVPDGKRIDFLTGRVVNDTPEEYVRQNIERALTWQYSYDSADCEPDFPIFLGSSRRRVDIAVFRPGYVHAQENIYIVIEIKKEGVSRSSRTDGIGKLRSYLDACQNAFYGMWTTGIERVCLAKRGVPGDRFEMVEIPDIPAAGKTGVDVQRPRHKDLRPATGDNLLFTFRRCRDYIAYNQEKQKSEAFLELMKLIFCKIEDERSDTLNFYITAAERESAAGAATTKSRIEVIYRNRVLNKYPAVLSRTDQEIDLKASVIAYVVSQLQNISLLMSPADAKGTACEELVGAELRGSRGEFFTPRNACRMAISMINPEPGERLIDPASGAGGFLTIAMNHVMESIKLEHQQRWHDQSCPTAEERDEYRRVWQEYLSTKLFGIDINPFLVRAAKMNMVINNDGSGGLWQGNSLANPHKWSESLAENVSLGSFPVVLTNPPFGVNVRIEDQEILNQYELARFWDLDEASGEWIARVGKDGHYVLQRKQLSEILFIERCVQLLEDGGRMAIVLPKGILNNTALGYVRQWIRQNTRILAVVDMARELFQPGNDTQASMVLLRKLFNSERAAIRSGELDYPIFMAIAEKVGKDRRGNTIYKRDSAGDFILVVHTETIAEINEQGNETYREIQVKERLIDDELPEVAVAYRSWLADHL